jgi:hypothetical protein
VQHPIKFHFLCHDMMQRYSSGPIHDIEYIAADLGWMSSSAHASTSVTYNIEIPILISN